MISEKKLIIPRLRSADDLEKDGVSAEIGEVNWPETYGYRPEVTLFCGYTGREIVLKYRVREDYVAAKHTRINSEVYRDSCVEFFISPGGSRYYNVEFNCIGTAYAAFGGPDLAGRVLLEEKKVSQIKTFSTLGNGYIDTRKNPEPWELTVAIPFALFDEIDFGEIDLSNPKGRTFRGNFFKCGDDLPVPHYLSWNPVTRKGTPNFHLPEYFGELQFV